MIYCCPAPPADIAAPFDLEVFGNILLWNIAENCSRLRLFARTRSSKNDYFDC